MKLLLDSNISRRAAAPLRTIWPTHHTSDLGLSAADDIAIWQFARENGYTIVTKDEDFEFLSRLRGYPPKVIWLRIGNCTTHAIAATLINNRDEIERLHLADVAMITIERSTP